MNGIDPNERAGAAPTATGPDAAKVVTPATPDSVNEPLAPDAEPCEKVAPDGAELLNRIHAFVCRFICYPSSTASIAHVLWIAHAHLMEAWFSTPRLAILSPEPGSGKSRVLEITALLVPRPLLSVNSSAAYVLRKVADQDNRPTVLYDEIDTIFGSHARGNEDLRGMINAGYRKGFNVGRCHNGKDSVLPQELATYAAVALSGLGDLPDTIMSRSVVIRMRKRGPDEVVEPFQPRHHEPPGQVLHDELAAWAASVGSKAALFQPEMPDGIADRNADIWGPLLTVAELAGGPWLDLARKAAVETLLSAILSEQPSLGARLLADIQRCFGEIDRLTTSNLLNTLLADDEAPWGDLRGRKIDARKLADMLRPYGISSSTIRMPDGSTPKGYRREAFHDSWKRYLPTPEPAATSATSATEPDSPEGTGTPGLANGNGEG